MLCNNISSATNFSPTKAHFGFTKPIFIMSSLINAVNVKKDLAYHSNSNNTKKYVQILHKPQMNNQQLLLIDMMVLKLYRKL